MMAKYYDYCDQTLFLLIIVDQRVVGKIQPRIFGVRNLFGGFTCVFIFSGFVTPALTLPCSRGNSEGLYIWLGKHLRIGTSCPQSVGN